MLDPIGLERRNDLGLTVLKDRTDLGNCRLLLR